MEDSNKGPRQALDFLAVGMTVAGILFPFKQFFSNAPQPLFPGSYVEDLEVAESCFRYLANVFEEIDECRAFELLRNMHDRSNHLLTKQAKIIAMTCTHAALTRQTLVELNFKYDNLVMEESAQILEVETFIPMLLQQASEGVSPLKRVILIGDHHQLPPVVKNQAFQQYGRLDQSLFSRFIRLQTPYVQLNMQGRCRASLAQLFAWRYENLGNLPHVDQSREYITANTGLAFDYQFINVADYEGRGETAPLPYFYQNLGEAEYVVALYMYLRLLGYPRQRISILSMYNGQKELIKEIVSKRCGWNPAIGWPSRITTVDKYQGQQNDYVLVSLVRTFTVGHIRDIRRWIVAISRARLGLYVFGRHTLFTDCYELSPSFKYFNKRPIELALHDVGESFSTDRHINETTKQPFFVKDIFHMWQIVQAKAAENVARLL